MGFRKPMKQKIGGKFLVYGFTGEGKSFFGATFPKVAAIDSETGLGFYEGIDIEIGGKKYNNIVFIDTTSDLDTLEEDLDAIIEGEVEGVETLLIDSESKFYNAMDIGATEAEERKAKMAGKSVDNRSKWGRVKNINMKLQQAKLTASAQGIHVVSTAQCKEIKDDDTGKLIGYKLEAHSSLKFDYDTILRFYVETDKKTKERKYYAEVEKDRTHVTKVGQIIENCTYDVWSNYFAERNGLKTSGANFSNDLKNSTQSVLNDAELSTKLATDLKETIKALSSTNKKLVKDKLEELQIDLKAMDLSNPEDLKKALEYFKSLEN